MATGGKTAGLRLARRGARERSRRAPHRPDHCAGEQRQGQDDQGLNDVHAAPVALHAEVPIFVLVASVSLIDGDLEVLGLDVQCLLQLVAPTALVAMLVSGFEALGLGVPHPLQLIDS